MKAIYAIDCILRNGSLKEQGQMGIIYGNLNQSTADVVNNFGRCSITWGDVLSETNYLYSYGTPFDTSMVKGVDGEDYNAMLLNEGDETIYLYKLD